MLGMLRNPPPCFAAAVRRHFFLRREAILETVFAWVDDAELRQSRSSLDRVRAFRANASVLAEELAKLDPDVLVDPDSDDDDSDSGG